MMRFYRLFVPALLLSALMPLAVRAQAPECSGSPQPICPGLAGSALIQCLEANYRPDPSNMNAYAGARDEMYGDIDNDGGAVVGVYSGFTITGVPQDPNVAPRTDAFNKGINTEHTWPQSLGISSSDPGARSDIHHLFPTRIEVNSARGNLPFEELDDDAETDTWYINATVQSAKPTSNIDGYSERDVNNAFEPGEVHEGNAARAIFYVYAVYNSLVGGQTAFFDGQKDDLRQWHQIDPADDGEVERTCKIALVQDNRVNPFVIDPTLVDRAFFGGDPGISMVTVSDVTRTPFLPMVNEATTITATLEHTLPLQTAEIRYTINGGTVQTSALTNSSGATYTGAIPATAYGNGDLVTYSIYAEDTDGISDESEAASFFAGDASGAHLNAVDGDGVLLYEGVPARFLARTVAGEETFANLGGYMGGIQVLGDVENHTWYTVEGMLDQQRGEAVLVLSFVREENLSLPVAPEDATIEQLRDDPETFEGSLIQIYGVRLEGDLPASGEGDVSIRDVTGTLTMHIDPATGIIPSDAPDGLFNLVGIFGQHDPSLPFTSGYRVLPRDAGDFLIMQPPATTTVQFGTNAATVTETEGAYELMVAITEPASTPTTVEIAVTGGTAEVDADFAFETQTVTFPANSSDSQEVTVTLTDDDAVENDETIVFSLQNPAGGNNATLGTPATFTLTLQSEDVIPPMDSPNAWFNELHYDNTGTDTNEFVESAVPEAFADLDRLAVVLYNGSNGTIYETTPLTLFTPGATEEGISLYTFTYPSNGIQNGDPDGLALCFDRDGDGAFETPVVSGTTTQFLSYEGAFTASGGCADGLTSTDIGLAESSATPETASLGLTGEGTNFDAFQWTVFPEHSKGMPNNDDRTSVEAVEVANDFTLHHNAPNPFSTHTEIRYTLRRPAPVRLRVFNALGREVAMLVNTTQPSGFHTARFDADELPSGVYFYQLEAAGITTTRTMLLLR